MNIVIALILSLLIGLITGPSIIGKLRELKFGQNIREEGNKEHLKKQGTPTMGGIIFIVAIFLSTLIVNKFNIQSLIITLGMILFGIIGFLDDILKIKKKQSEGLSPKGKILLNIIFGLIMGVVLVIYFNHGQTLTIPLVGNYYIHPIVYIPFIIIFYTAVTNSVNLADGIDGLCGSVSMMVTIFYLVFLLTKGSIINGAAYMAIYAGATIGGILAYLYFNWHPAKVFMGDAGSFAMGGLLATISVLTNTEILFILIGLIYVIESLSVIIQVSHYKKTKERIFKMAPIHHHFELSGWSELKIVIVFSLFTMICTILAYLIL